MMSRGRQMLLFVVLGTVWLLVTTGTGLAVATSQTSVSLSPTNIAIDPGETTQLGVVVEEANSGVGAISATVEITDPEVAEITNVTLEGDPGVSDVNIPDDGSSATVDGALMDTPDDGSVTAVTVTVRGVSDDEGTLSLDVDALGDEAGNEYTVTRTDGASLTVGGDSRPATADPTATASVTTASPAAMAGTSATTSGSGAISGVETPGFELWGTTLAVVAALLGYRFVSGRDD